MATANNTTSLCSVDGCGRPMSAREYCTKHYSMWRRTGNPIRACIDCGKDITGTRGGARSCPECRVCSIQGCDKPSRTRKMCNMHAKRENETGTPYRKCETCGQDMPQNYGGSTYCSKKCRPRCKAEGCERSYYYSNGYCVHHNERIKRHGDPNKRVYWTPKAEQYVCIVCGKEFLPNGTSRQFCHVNCQGLYSRYGGEVPPHDFNCGMCGELVVHGRDGNWVRRDKLVCDRCKSSSNARHGTSAGALALRDGNICRLCDQEVDMSLRFPSKFAGTVDHIVPVSRGGDHSPENLQLAHQSCNSKKQARIDYTPA